MLNAQTDLEAWLYLNIAARLITSTEKNMRLFPNVSTLSVCTDWMGKDLVSKSSF